MNPQIYISNRYYIQICDPIFCASQILVECFVKDGEYIWYAVNHYDEVSKIPIILNNTFLTHNKSKRPYMAGQACNGSICAPVFHLAHQLSMYLQIDFIEMYNRTYPDETMDYTELQDTLRFANWQGVEIIQHWNSRKIDLVIQSIQNINFHQLANELELEVASI